MVNVARGFLVLVAFVFLLLGLRWWLDPAGAASEFGMTLSSGVGLSTEVGDISSLFLTGSLFMFISVVRRESQWLYAPLALVVLAASGRIIAWLLHDAAFATQFILTEVVIALIAFYAIKVLDRASENADGGRIR
ncbi:hypothetical protein [Aequoribacter sp.]|uniref:hypothetical protein n=1 Tax=Aequoribacter sp. TaxID=2847771 RepID=UPI003F6A2282